MAWVFAQFVLLLVYAALPAIGPRVAAPGARVLAVLVALAGLGVLLWGGRALGPSLQANPAPKPDGTLRRGGPYARVRHPMYAGVLLMALGWALWRQSLLHFAFAALLALFFDAKARHEERLLVRRYPDYEAYRRRTRRLIPWLY